MHYLVIVNYYNMHVLDKTICQPIMIFEINRDKWGLKITLNQEFCSRSFQCSTSKVHYAVHYCLQ